MLQAALNLNNQSMPDYSSLSILVLEDHIFQRDVAISFLQQLGITQIVEASEGREALDRMRAVKFPIDVVLCDLKMEGMDGVEFIRHMAEANFSPAIILVSGMETAVISSVENMAEAHKLQVLGTIEKPLSVQKLANLLAKYESVREVAQAQEIYEPTFEELAGGIERGEFIPYFQPEVDIQTLIPKGFEVLARWNHPSRGVLRPARFLNAVDKNQLMNAFTDAILHASLDALRSWQDAGLDVTISVNLSLSYLGQPNVADSVSQMVKDHGLAANKILVEVTESSAASRLATVLENLARLRIKDFGIAIDDYGTGYSTMQQLSRIPFTQLKLDRSFVSGAAHKASLRTILESSLHLAKKLNLQSVAEGIELESEWSLLKSMGCDLAQGYYVAMPIPPDDVVKWHRNWKAGLEP
jgi:EAL domain-containing protein (putative c-di-GMP-specific phosphodiesterase class I)/ActR/RegA family two-component response regulator